MPEEFAVTERRLADGRCSKRVAVRIWKRLPAMIQMTLQRTLGQAARARDAGSRAFRGVGMSSGELSCSIGGPRLRTGGF
jgi:hypothetical protein